jgi:hypothetical protein
MMISPRCTCEIPIGQTPSWTSGVYFAGWPAGLGSAERGKGLKRRPLPRTPIPASPNRWTIRLLPATSRFLQF